MPSWTKEQSLAINEEGSNIIVSAGAGSGKTAVLSERVIRKLKNGVHINELLLLTFTKAAAAEMKQRIRKKISKVESIISELDMIDASYITTFDSFALSVVKKYHYLLNISHNVNIIDDAVITIKKEEIMDKIFENKYLMEDKNFLHLIDDFCVKDDKNIQKEILAISNKLDMLPNKEEYLTNYITNHFSDLKIEEDINKYIELIKKKRDKIEGVCNELSSYFDSDYMNSLYGVLDSVLNANSYDELKASLNISIPRIPKGASEEGKKAKEKLADILKTLGKMCIYESREYIKSTILFTKDYVKTIIDIILEFDKKVSEFKFINDAYEFNDIALLAIKLVRDFPEVREEIKNSFNEIMIDEYQDTNDLQEEFISYISNNNVYMVGDIKQSIYRFRNANPNIFKNKYDNYSINNGGIKIDLNKNFRSRKEVLENVNLMFNLIMSDLIGGADYISTHQMIFGNNAYINEGSTNQNYNIDILEYNYDKDSEFTMEEIECFIIADDIKKKVESHYQVFDKDELILRDIRYSDFAILIDRSSTFDLFKKIFEYKQIPLNILKEEKMNNDKDVYVLNNLLRFIIKISNHEYDTTFKYLFVSLMRSFIINETDDVIFKCFLNNNFKDNYLYKKSLKISKKVNNVSVKELLNIIIEEFDFYEKLIMIGNIDTSIIKTDKILDMASSLSDLGYTIEMFSEHLDKLVKENYTMKYQVNNDFGDAVKIMTIHKSKGLEYHICYFPNMYKKFNLSELNEKFLYSNKVGIVSPFFDEGIGETIYKTLLKNDYLLEEISEKIRLFYVAVTRAKEKMIIVLPNKDIDDLDNEIVLDDEKKEDYRTLGDFIYSIRNRLDNYITKVELDKLEMSKDYNIIASENFENSIIENNTKLDVKNINIDNSEIESSSFSKKMHELINMETKNNIELGLKMHEILENTDFKNIVKLDNKFYQDKIDKLVNSSLFKNIKDSKIYKEYEFIYFKDDIKYHGIIDLMLEYSDHIDIVDYKLKNVDDEKYILQLKGYQEFVRSNSGKPVSLYLYSIIDSAILKIE